MSASHRRVLNRDGVLAFDRLHWLPAAGGTPSNTYSANCRYSQAARILKHLRDELHLINPKPPQLTSTMIDHLVFNCPVHLVQGDDWQLITIDVIDYFIEHLDPLMYKSDFFMRSDRPMPLFPNEELFDEFDTFNFFQQLLQFTHNEFS